jgi:hypothetical protein
VIRGNKDEAQEWSHNISAIYAPRRLVFAIPADAELPESLASKQVTNSTVAYICRGTTCSAAINSLEALANELSES